ncbi:class C sortase [Pediococcus pentosaceus]|uniref:class C sortase n=1 Tax=Pediococcus pentosaceus TaxID=1255 RepID=UPI00223C4739|nr:class C sortase [Pediococcus pentosaceus]MCT1178699.1 class C sortase [Pediococcus pentosaceus]
MFSPPNKPGKTVNLKSLFLSIICFICFLTFVGLLSYPFISDYLTGQRQERAIANYDSQKATSNKEYLKKMFALQKETVSLDGMQDPFKKTHAKKTNSNTVNVAKAALTPVGVLSIPKINLQTPIYNNTSDEALDEGVGVMAQTDMPLGGKGKLSAIAGHSGNSLSKRFTQVLILKKDDYFYIKVNGRIHAYRIFDIKKYLPDQVYNHLKPNKSKDLVTLMTCTPLGINSHRLLVTGERVPYVPGALNKQKGLTPFAWFLISISLIAAILFLSFLIKRCKNKILINEVK